MHVPVDAYYPSKQLSSNAEINSYLFVEKKEAIYVRLLVSVCLLIVAARYDIIYLQLRT